MRPVGARNELHDGLDSAPVREAALGDVRFRALLSEEDWATLTPAIRRRFSVRLTEGKTMVYVGTIVEMQASALGRLLAHVARLAGGPLPYGADIGVPSIVTVTEDMGIGGQIWTRLYTRRRGFPQIIHSSKRFAGPTGLEEYLGRGLGMALTLHVENRALVFRSAGYYLQVFGRRFMLPRWLTPGALAVTHEETGGESFIFSLDLVHPLLGRLVRQSGIFRETDT
jgi:hypothetical protein